MPIGIILKKTSSAGEVPSGNGDSAPSDGSAEFEDRNGDESDEEQRSRDSPSRASPDVEENIVTPGNFDDHMGAEMSQSNIPVQRLVQSVKQASAAACFFKNIFIFLFI